MKSVIFVALALVAVGFAAPATPADHVPQTLRSEFNKQSGGGYDFGFETDNGITRQENGEVKTVPDEDNKPQEVVVVRGSYTYINSEGNSETISYYADETGFHAEGPSIPKAPEATR